MWYEHLFGVLAVIVCAFTFIVEMLCVIIVCSKPDIVLKEMMKSIEASREMEG